MWKILKKLSCFSLASILRIFARRFVSPSKRTTSMTIIEDTTEKLLKENSIASGGLLKSGEIPHSDIILKRTISCPSTLMDQTVQAQVHTDGNTIPQINHSILKA